VRQWLNQKVAGKIPAIFRNVSATPGATKLTIKGIGEPESSAITNLEAYYGTSKTALIHKITMTTAEFAAGKDITALVAGVKYFVQVRVKLPAPILGSNSGIYYGTPTA